ncbi:MAG: gas vesicle protein GvpG [Parcubacteria group bacterium CG23_combo_of_CG06-09_8_20_14_all_35_9]|nr:MAG: gas vesicle protein GvpG [Parcubacteria group bacterium CG23_combo_of_CG06-09_8_20_14_all_35_9]
MLLIDDLLRLPWTLGKKVLEKIRDMALEELEDTPEKLKKELLDLQMDLDSGKITEEEYKKKEDDILKRLTSLKKSKK